MRRLLVAAIAALLIAAPVSAAAPLRFGVSLNATGLHHGDLVTFDVHSEATKVWSTSYWVQVDCRGDDGTFYLQHGPISDWIGSRHAWDGTAGPFQLGSGLVIVMPGSAGTTAGDWFAGGGDCRAFVWEHGGWGLDMTEAWRVSPIVTFRVEG